MTKFLNGFPFPPSCLRLPLSPSVPHGSFLRSLAPSSPEFKRSDKRKATAVTAAAPDLPEVKADCKPREGSPKRSGISVQLIPTIWNGDGAEVEMGQSRQSESSQASSLALGRTFPA